jgi:hypothetical protein
VTTRKRSLYDAQALKSEQTAKEAQKQTRPVDSSTSVEYPIPRVEGIKRAV